MRRRRIAVIVLEPPERVHGSLSPRRWAPNLRCGICGEKIHRWQPFNVDHVVPMSLGGKRGKTNKVFAHLLCNSVKGNRHPFSLRTPSEREAVRALVSPVTYERLRRTWSGQSSYDENAGLR